MILFLAMITLHLYTFENELLSSAPFCRTNFMTTTAAKPCFI